jgi:hypothetical protein
MRRSARDPLAGADRMSAALQLVNPQAAAREEMLRTCRVMIQPGDVVEVRIPKTERDGTISGYFNEPEKLVDAVLAYDGKVPAIYFTMNPCKPALLARAANRLRVRAAVTTSDHDISRRRWLLIDCDPKRPAGISSTEHEHERAFSIAYGILDELHSVGFPGPVLADSGNGCHLLYRIELPNDAHSTDLITRVLRGIDQRCSTDDVAVDLTVFNAARITKLYGTVTCKGDSTTERPHRRSRILEVPDPLRTLEAE